MGFRFQKRVPIFPGVYLNLSKSGVSLSLGGHGASVNLGSERRTINFGIPGTGMSYRMPISTGIIGAVLLAALIIAVVYAVKPDLIKPVLHMWQPRLFPN